jgi:hypothetical protein
MVEGAVAMAGVVLLHGPNLTGLVAFVAKSSIARDLLRDDLWASGDLEIGWHAAKSL